jgi:flagellar biosynthesis/type III secretory pathway protein FliH
VTPKEKAAELFNKFENTLPDAVEVSKQHIVDCALIAVDEIIKTFDCTTPQSIEYWQEVKQEIELL